MSFPQNGRSHHETEHRAAVSTDRFRATIAVIVSIVLGTAAVATPPTSPSPLTPSSVNGPTPDGEHSASRRGTSLRTILAAFQQEPRAASPETIPIDEIDMSDLDALRRRLNLDSLDSLEPDLEEMERRLNLDAEVRDPELRPLGNEPDDAADDDLSKPNRGDGDDDDGDVGDDSDDAVIDQFEQALPEIVGGRFVMPPLVVASLDTESIGNGRRPDSFRAKAEVPRMPLPESALDRAIVWNPMLRTWAASGNFSHPLYFEDRMLERHGHTRWGYLQPLVSGARFYSGILFLPYLASIEHPCQCRYSMGYFRSGTCVPAFYQRPPWDREALVAQSLASAGGLWILP